MSTAAASAPTPSASTAAALQAKEAAVERGPNCDAPPGTGVNWSGCLKARADLSLADLDGANLSYAYLAGAYLSGASLSGASLTGIDFIRPRR